MLLFPNKKRHWPAGNLSPLPLYRWEIWAPEKMLLKDPTFLKWQEQNFTLKSIYCYLFIRNSQLGSFLHKSSNDVSKHPMVYSDGAIHSHTGTPYAQPMTDYSQFLRHHLVTSYLQPCSLSTCYVSDKLLKFHNQNQMVHVYAVSLTYLSSQNYLQNVGNCWKQEFIKPLLTSVHNLNYL